MASRTTTLILLLCMVVSVISMPRSLDEEGERQAVLKEIKELSSVINLIDMPEDDTPKGPEDEDDESSGSANPECRNEIERKNSTANETEAEKPDLIHANFDTLCDKTNNGTIKKLPVYLVGWELKKHCGGINVIPYKRFKMEEYSKRPPRFDIAGLCLPMKGKEMTLLMVDPDAPSRTSHRCRSWVHWMVVDIPKGNVKKGREIISYKPPNPPAGSGPHRYFFLLYEQNHHIQKIDDSENNMAVRCGFNVRNFAEDNSLIGPVALNMFITERKRKSEENEEMKKEEKKKEEKKKEEKKKEDKRKEEKKNEDKKKEEEKDNDMKDEKLKDTELKQEKDKTSVKESGNEKSNKDTQKETKSEKPK